MTEDRGEDRLRWLEANAARCLVRHPTADCHRLYRRNAEILRAELRRRLGKPGG